MDIVSFMDDRVLPCLKGGAPTTNDVRQTAANVAADVVQSTHIALSQNLDTYFLETDKKAHRYTAVLGWDHGMLLRKSGDFYRPVRVYCHKAKPNHSAYGVLDPSTKPVIKELTASDPARYEASDGEIWCIFEAPDVVLERLVTYGVSSCSFCVLRSADLEYIAVSHMDGTPPIPVGFMMAALDPPGKSKLVASIFAQEAEALKIGWTRDLRVASKVSGLLIARGKVPEPDTGIASNPSMNHADIGIELATGKPPKLRGTLGVENDINYSRLIPAGLLRRLENFGTEESLSSGYLFKEPWTVVRTLESENTVAITALFARQGHMLGDALEIEGSGEAPSQLMQSKAPATKWTITDTRKRRTYSAQVVTRTIDATLPSFPFAVARSGETGNLRDPDNILDSWLNNRAIASLQPVFTEAGLQLRDDATITTIEGRPTRWRVVNGPQTITVSQPTSTFSKPVSQIHFFSMSEAVDIVADVIKPLMDGEHGFGELHTAMIEAFAARAKTRAETRSRFAFMRDAYQEYEHSVEQSISKSLTTAERELCLASRFLAHVLAEALRGKSIEGHPNIDALTEVTGAHRYDFDIPLDVDL